MTNFRNLSCLMDADDLAAAETYKNSLLRELLTTVKECQKKYGTRAELATELDPFVADICRCFEEVFTHGLRKKVSTRSSKKFVNLTFNGKPTFWSCVTNILSGHERDRYNSLQNVKTNLGKGRSWLRSALNERSLERYLNTLICNEELLNLYYEPCAFLCDQEKSYILSTAAGGLAPILFAISIDRIDLNHYKKNGWTDSNSEQVIVTVPMDVCKITDVRKKLQSNVIEFESTGEDNTEFDELSRSVPKMDITSAEFIEDATECTEDYSPHDSEDNMSDGLRPVCDQVVGELIPVSSEACESDTSTLFPDFSSEDAVSVESGDEANFQKLYELGKEELKKQISSNSTLEARVAELNRENEVLKHQLRKYVSAVQMLKRDDADHSYEAQLYESKLVQVAEMHGELMELNRRLQISLLAKGETISRLQEELVSLRGPLPSEDFSLHKLVSLWVPSAFLSGRYTDPHHVYQVHFRIGSEEWNIYRRYAQFYAFHQRLKKEYSVTAAFQFPPKKTLGNKDANFVEERRKKIQLYLRQVINFLVTQDSHLASNPTKSLFTSRVQFFGEHYVDTPKSRSHSIFSNCLQPSQAVEEDSPVQYTGL